MLDGRRGRCRVQPDRRRNQQGCTRDREQSPAGPGSRSQGHGEGDHGDSNQGDRQLREEGRRKTRLGQAADRADERVIAWSQPPGEQYSGGRNRRSSDPQSACQSLHFRAQLRVYGVRSMKSPTTVKLAPATLGVCGIQ
jgi:hypothetical protein